MKYLKRRSISKKKENQSWIMSGDSDSSSVVSTDNRCRRIWDDASDRELLSIVKSYGRKKISWKEIGERLNKNRKQCLSRYLRIKPGVVKGKWSKQEDDTVLGCVKKFGKKWAEIARIMKNRCAKQIRDRYNNYLDETINREEYTTNENETILNLYIKHGPRWELISKALIGRPASSIKNHFIARLKSSLKEWTCKSRSTKTAESLEKPAPIAIVKDEPKVDQIDFNYQLKFDFGPPQQIIEKLKTIPFFNELERQVIQQAERDFEKLVSCLQNIDVLHKHYIISNVLVNIDHQLEIQKESLRTTLEGILDKTRG